MWPAIETRVKIYSDTRDNRAINFVKSSKDPDGGVVDLRNETSSNDANIYVSY